MSRTGGRAGGGGVGYRKLGKKFDAVDSMEVYKMVRELLSILLYQVVASAPAMAYVCIRSCNLHRTENTS